MKMTTNIPEEITMPDSVETSLGTLRFFDGLRDKLTVFTLLRLYGALEPWFDKTWRPGDIELV
jgi:hypothetical protein